MLTARETHGVLLRAGVNPRTASVRAPFLVEAFAFAELDSAERVAAFLGQSAHETLAWRYTSEIWGPTRTQLRYERNFDAPWPTTPAQSRSPEYARNKLAYTLGNTQAGDGSRYRGRGDIQVTGRANTRGATRRLRDRLGSSAPDFLVAPQLLASPEWASLTAADYWIRRKLNEWVHDTRELTRRINGGYNGLADREQRTALFLSLITSG